MKILGYEFTRASSLPVARIEPTIEAAETSGTNNPNPAIFDAGWSGAGASARLLPNVTATIAERHGTVFSCCNIIAADLAKVPLRVWQKNVGGTETQVEGHPLNYLLNVEASIGVPAKIARFALAYPFALRGQSIHYAPRDGGGELEMIDLINQDQCQVYRQGRTRVYQFTDGAEVRRNAPARSMVHLRYMALDGWTGRSPLQVAADSVGLAIAGQTAAARTAVGTTARAVIMLDDNYEDEESRIQNARRVKETLRGNDSSDMAVLNAGEDVKVLDLSAADQELLASRKFDREMIAGIYRMPPSKLQMLEHGVKANGQQQAIDYRTDCLLHWGGFVEAGMAQSLLTEKERRAGLFLRHDYSVLMLPTTQEHYTALHTAVGGPIMTANTAQKLANLPVTPDGDKLNPAPNMTRKETPKQKVDENGDD